MPRRGVTWVATLVLCVLLPTCSFTEISQASHEASVEVGAKEISKVRHSEESAPKSTRPSLMRVQEPAGEWFNHIPFGRPGKHEDVHQHQLDGFNLNEVHSKPKQQKAEKKKNLGSAGIPILQAYMTRPVERDTWPRDPGDPEPGDDVVGLRPADVGPGDALLEVASEVSHGESHDAQSRKRRGSQCMWDCMDCSNATINGHFPDAGAADGNYCMCYDEAGWADFQRTPGTAQPPFPPCQEHCGKNISGWTSSCPSNCTCDLNVYWEPVGTVHASDGTTAAPQ